MKSSSRSIHTPKGQNAAIGPHLGNFQAPNLGIFRVPITDISVADSRQFRDFEDYLMPHPEFDRRLTQGELHVAVPTTAVAYIEERMSLLRSALDQTNALAREDQLPDAELNSTGLKISPLENSVPKEAEALRDALSRMLPHVKITDLLM